MARCQVQLYPLQKREEQFREERWNKSRKPKFCLDMLTFGVYFPLLQAHGISNLSSSVFTGIRYMPLGAGLYTIHNLTFHLSTFLEP